MENLSSWKKNKFEFKLYSNLESESPLDFSIDEVSKMLQNLKTGKSPGPDGLHPRFVNELADDLCLP